MAKGHKHLKRLKSEKAKVKLKSKKSVNQLPKNLNVTDTSFKAKKILIREQLKTQDETHAVLSIRKLNIKDLLVRLQHHNFSVREGALKQLKDILLRYPLNVFSSELNSLLRGIAALSLDQEKGIRKNALNALNLILSPISKKQLIPFSEVLISYLNCAMTHINPNIKEDSLNFLDVLVQNCGSILASYIHRILPNFLGMICSLNREIKPGKQLMTVLNSKSTSLKWRIKVLQRLANMFTFIGSQEKVNATAGLNVLPTIRNVKNNTEYIPIYSGSLARDCEVDFNESSNLIKTYCVERTLPIEDLVKYADAFMPLMFDIWLEVCLSESHKSSEYTEVISSEASELLKSIIDIIQSFIEYIDMLDCNDDDAESTKRWFVNSFHNSYMKNFLSSFPYAKDLTKESKKRKGNFSQSEDRESCLEQNLGLCYIHIWFTTLINSDKQFPKSTKDYCISVTKYLNDIIENWCVSERSALQQFTKLLRTLFLKASSVWCTNGIDLSQTIRLIMEVSSDVSRKELESHFSIIVGNIILDCNSNKLYGEKMFKKFVATLPNLLLRSSIDDVMIKMIAQIVLRFKEWIRKELEIKHEAIIENAKRINIIGSSDDKHSRLMICNLFYFMDGQIYY